MINLLQNGLIVENIANNVANNGSYSLVSASSIKPGKTYAIQISGTSAAGAQQGTRGEDDTYSGISNVEFIGRKLQYKTRKYLTLGGKEYVPDGRPNQHSPFARQFFKALRNFGGEDNILTIGELISFVEKVDPQPTFGDFQGDQAGSDFIFIAK